MKIYIVKDGEYSDYGIEAVFTDKHKAEIYASTHNCNWVEEYETMDENIEGDSDVFVCHKIGVYGDKFLVDSTWYSSYNRKNSIEPKHYSTVIFVTLNENNEEKAIKIAQDMYAKYRAEKLGL